MIMTLKTKLVTLASILLLIIVGFLSFHIYDKHTSNIKVKEDNAIVAMSSTITTDKQATVTLQKKEQTDLAPIHHLQPIAQAAKTEAIANVLQIETDHPADAQMVEEAAQPLETALTDQEQVSEATQTALDDAQSVDAAQDKTIDDQSTQIQNYQTDLATTEQQVKTETTRKVWYRRGFFVVASIIIIHIAL